MSTVKASILFGFTAILLMLPCFAGIDNAKADREFWGDPAIIPTQDEMQTMELDRLVYYLLLPRFISDGALDVLIDRIDEPGLHALLSLLDEDEVLEKEINAAYELYAEEIGVSGPDALPMVTPLAEHRIAECKIKVEGLLFFLGDKKDERFEFLLSQLGGAPSVLDIFSSINPSTDLCYIERLIEYKVIEPERTSLINSILSHFPDVGCARESVLGSLNDNDPQIVYSVLLDLGYMIENSEDRYREELLQPLLNHLHDDNPELRRAACGALRFGGECEGVESSLWDVYNNDVDDSVRLFAIYALAEIAEPDGVVPELIDWLEEPPFEAAEELIIQALYELGPMAADAIPALERYLEPDNERFPWFGYYAARALASVKGEEFDPSEYGFNVVL